jgi:hypothetical protein
VITPRTNAAELSGYFEAPRGAYLFALWFNIPPNADFPAVSASAILVGDRPFGRQAIVRIPEHCRLIRGPYAAPRCRMGDVLTCEARNSDVVVGCLSDAPIPWPFARKGGQNP